MMLTECTPGDLVVVMWPNGSDYSVGQFGDVFLRGTEVYVLYGAPGFFTGGSKKKSKPTVAFITIVDPETLLPIPHSFRTVPDCEVVDIIEHKHPRSDDAGDETDPMQQRNVRPLV